MAAKPAYSSQALNYGTDANYATMGDAHDGAPTKVAPTVGLVRQGFWRPGRQIGGQFMNWVLQQFALVMSGLVEHTAELEEADEAIREDLGALARRMTVGSSALTFGRPFTEMGDLKFAAYDEANRLWYVCGGAKNVHASHDFGGWFAANEIAAVGPGSEDCTWLDVDGSGNVVVATNTRYAFEKTASTGTWTRVDIAGGGVPAQTYAIAYDPVRARWIWAGQNVNASFAQVMTSANRTTWTSGSLLPNTSLRNLVCKKSSGLVLFAGVNGSTGKISVTLNAGQSWVTYADLAFGFTPQDAHLSYDRENDAWYLAVSRYSGGYQSEVWRSTDDGMIWTRRCALASSRVLRIAAIDSLLVSVATHALPGAIVGEEVVFSLDGGATWLPAGLRPMGSTALGAFTGPNAGAVLVMTTTHAYVSGRTLQPSWAPLT